MSSCDLAAICDFDAAALAKAAELAPEARTTDDLDAVLADDGIDAVALATPVPTHADLAVKALEAGKHVFVEKPLAKSVADAERAVAAADAAGKKLMVGHLLEYHPAVEA